jgi:hypothetical protein
MLAQEAQQDDAIDQGVIAIERPGPLPVHVRIQAVPLRNSGRGEACGWGMTLFCHAHPCVHRFRARREAGAPGRCRGEAP